jgi:hypothetical protein
MMVNATLITLPYFHTSPVDRGSMRIYNSAVNIGQLSGRYVVLAKNAQ